MTGNKKLKKSKTDWVFSKGSKKKFLNKESADNQWSNSLELLRHFGTRIENNRLILPWYQTNTFSSYLLIKMLSSITKRNIVAIYDKKEGSWILMER